MQYNDDEQFLVDLFDKLDEQAICELVENQEVSNDDFDISQIKEKTFNKLELKPKKARIITMSRIFNLAAVLVIVFVSYQGLIGLGILGTSPIEKGDQLNPIEIAIENSDESKVLSLLSNTAFVTQETLDFAIENLGKISYNAVQNIAQSVYSIFGTTGLSSILENAILGNSDLVIKELKNSKNQLQDSINEVVVYFSAAFCDSEVLQTLMQLGIDLDITDFSGNSIYAIAKQTGNEQTLEFVEVHDLADKE